MSSRLLVAHVPLWLAAFPLAGCAVQAEGATSASTSVEVGGQTRKQPPSRDRAGRAKAHVRASGAPQTASGVQVIEASCAADAEERCNGLDDNCNGQIDEGCGYESGSIQVTLHWSSGADLDLYVTDPHHETLYYDHNRSNSGGYLDHDARGQCRPRDENNRIENVYWEGAPPSGEYQVDVHYWGTCNSGAGPTEVTLSISVGSEIIGAYRHTLNPGQRETVASFGIP